MAETFGRLGHLPMNKMSKIECFCYFAKTGLKMHLAYEIKTEGISIVSYKLSGLDAVEGCDTA